MNTDIRWTRTIKHAAKELLAEISSGTRAQVSPSVYETARLVQSARWLKGHEERVRFLLGVQRHDGSWGEPDGYALVPTLSVVEAFLAELRHVIGTPEYDALAVSACRGLAWLSETLAGRGRNSEFADTIAAEFIVPWLIDLVNAHLTEPKPLPGLDLWRTAHLDMPHGADPRPLKALTAAARAGKALPEKLWHSLEILGSAAGGARGVRSFNGAVGASPASTVAWLGGERGFAVTPADVVRSTTYLESVQRPAPGPVPGVSDITYFERAWVISSLATGGLAFPVARTVADSLDRAIGDKGAPAGPGLPSDSDDTAAVLYALAKIGGGRAPEVLWRYETEHYFRCFDGEHNPSTSTNAHILEVLATVDAGDRARRRTATHKIAAWLRDQQEPDGSWWDKWHASAYYATACCAMALDRSARMGTGAGDVVDKAVRWVLDTQRADGSWGRWEGTDEETSYALQTLLATTTPPVDEVAYAAARGCAFLLREDRGSVDPPLWHDKDLYTPTAVVRAARLGALNLAATCPRVLAAVTTWAPRRTVAGLA